MDLPAKAAAKEAGKDEPSPDRAMTFFARLRDFESEMLGAEMARYYVLTERRGIAVVQAEAVDQTSATKIRFLSGSDAVSFELHELVWWSPAESAPPAPFEIFGDAEPGWPLGRRPHASPWPGHVASPTPGKRVDHGRRSVAALQALAGELQVRVPADWRTVNLELRVRFEMPAGRYRITHRIRNASDGAETFDFSDSLGIAIDVFHRIAVECGHNWNGCTIALSRDAAGRKSEVKVSYNNGTNFA